MSATEESKTIRIICDHRESPSGIPRILGADSDVQCEMSELEMGDYQIGKHSVIERKSAADFVDSIIDRRLFSQADMIKETGTSAIYLIEGSIYETGRNIHVNALIGAMSYLATIEGHPIVHTSNATDSAMMIKTLARHSQHGLGYVPGLRPSTPKTLPDRQLWLLGGLPGLGEKRVKSLLSYFGTPAAVLSASPEELSKVEGIGKKTAEVIREVLETPFS